MRAMNLSLTTALLAAGMLAGCRGVANNPRFGDGVEEADPGVGGVEQCPYDPDCPTSGRTIEECQTECPGYWGCDDDLSERLNKPVNCTNPGFTHPGTGGGSGDWECAYDELGRVVCECEGPGCSAPGGGGGSGWDCMRNSEGILSCVNDDPGYPGGGGPDEWNCFFRNETTRICQSIPEGTPGGGGPGGWICTETELGETRCENPNPELPGGGGGSEWDCWYEQNGDAWTKVCRAPGDETDIPGGGGMTGWDCYVEGEFVICENDDPDVPPTPGGGSGGPSNCVSRAGADLDVCVFPPVGTPPGGTPPGGTPPGGTPPGGTPPGGLAPPFEPPGSACPEIGVTRWCDDATYCSWGEQTCLPNGTWSSCIEPAIGPDGLLDRPGTVCACQHFYFNPECCEDPATCYKPEDHVPPACETSGENCSFCDNDAECGGGFDRCLRRVYTMPGSGGALLTAQNFCGHSCRDEPCEAGYECRSMRIGGSVGQWCVPMTPAVCGDPGYESRCADGISEDCVY